MTSTSYRPDGNHPATKNSPEEAYVRGKTTQWLWLVMDSGANLDDDFFECLDWGLGAPGLSGLLREFIHETEQFPGNHVDNEVLDSIQKALKTPARGLLARECEELIIFDPYFKRSITAAIYRKSRTAKTLVRLNTAPYRQAGQRLARTFGISQQGQALCEFVFIAQQFPSVQRYFINKLEIYNYGARRLLSRLLGLSPLQLTNCLRELTTCGLLETTYRYSPSIELRAGIVAFWEDERAAAQALFCRRLMGKALPLSDFCIPREDILYARTLLEQDDKGPVHILLYGPPGTGKTSFARSLAKECGLKAWSVTSRAGDDDGDRRASLAACLHIAAKHRGAFVLVDEAERLLHTDMAFFGKTKDKAWLNEFLEEPGRRVIWTTNDPSRIDQAVRRRFTFSIHFGKLGISERMTIWRQILVRHRVAKRMPEERLTRLVRDYPVSSAVIDNAVARAKILACTKMDFSDTVERSLQAYSTLKHDGRKARLKPQAAEDFSLEGVCLEGSAHTLLGKCRQVDAAMRDGKTLPSQCATMLFYGPPGTGKTALARYIAKALDRECEVKRASDLLDPFVGMSEQKVAAAFRAAEQEGAVLVIDEADSFIYSRENAQRSWEASLVNEFLTALEESRGFVICTTNRREHLDAAAMRRFAHKVAFGYAKPDQVRALYAGLLQPLCTSPLPPDMEKELLRMTRLAPGDFHAVRLQYTSLFGEETTPTHQALVAALKREETLKTEQRACRIGFAMGA